MNRFLLYWLPLGIWIVGTLVVSALPSGSYPKETALPGFSSNYLLHVTAFFVLFLMCFRLFHSQYKGASRLRTILLSLGITLLVAVCKECLQLVAPTRTFSVADMLLDAAAAVTALLFTWIWLWRRILYPKKGG